LYIGENVAIQNKITRSK